MAATEVYQTVWKKYLPVIAMKIKEAIRKNGPVSFSLYKPEFQYAGKKKNIPFDFVLEMKNGRVRSAIGILPVAKDLSEALRQNPTMRDAMERAHFKFTATSDYILTVEVIPFVSDMM